MSDENKATGIPIVHDSEHSHAQDKGKGKAPVAEDVSMDEDSSSDEEDQVSD